MRTHVDGHRPGPGDDPERGRQEGADAASATPGRLPHLHTGMAAIEPGHPALDALAAVTAASPWLARVCANDPLAVEVLGDLAAAAPPVGDTEPFSRLARMKRLGVLRIAARDLLGIDDIRAVGAALSELATDLVSEALLLCGPAGSELAVVGMGKLGGNELNYASDIDLLMVSARDGVDAMPFVELARAAWQVDLALRPEGRAGALARTVASYQAYWSRWAQAWEFQALLKARPVAGAPHLRDAFEIAASEAVWSRLFGADELRQLRHLKARAEGEISRRGLAERELKRGPGGIRDIEFALQLLQLVHGRADPALRVRSTLGAISALAAGGYIDAGDARSLEAAYRFLRTVEHRLQLYEGQPVHVVPRSPERREHLARVLGYRSEGGRPAAAAFESDLRRHRTTTRAIHERLFFRPLLEVFSRRPRADRLLALAAGLSEDAAVTRLEAFGFTDAARTRRAVAELTNGFSRSSQLMQQMLPLLLDWLSATPDPDTGLLGLRTLADEPMSRDLLTAACRESLSGARALCRLLGTGARFARDLQRHPHLLVDLASGAFPTPVAPAELRRRLERSLAWREGERAVEQGLRAFTGSERLRIAALDVLEGDDEGTTGQALSDLADAVIDAALHQAEPQVPVAVIAMGGLGGCELGYASDLDLLVVYGESGQDAAAAADAAASALARTLAGATPATGMYRVDMGLRPEGRQGPPARSLDAYAAYYERWAKAWERQALLRARLVAGDQEVGDAFMSLAEQHLWGRHFTGAEEREIRRSKARMERERVPAGEDPKFHLKLGPGSLTDVEWTVQLLQLRHAVRQPGTMDALELLRRSGVVRDEDAATLHEAYRFCERARNRLALVRDLPSDSLPTTGPSLSVLARSLGWTVPGLRNEYIRVTRRCRRVVERLFYGSDDTDRK